MTVIRSAELISVGTELLLGEIVDTNSAYLATYLAGVGVDVLWSSRVGDNEGRIKHLLETGLSRSDLVVLGGGLGPTEDDLTRDAVAAVVGEEQTVDPELERWLREHFAAGGRRMPERNVQQAEVIASAEVLPNAIGTAPGWLVRTQWEGAERVIVTLPGPPRELKRMWESQAVPRLRFPKSQIFTRTYKTHGVGESSVADILGELTNGANPSVATYAKRDGVHVRVAAKGPDPESARNVAAGTMCAVEAALGESVWGTGDDEMATLVVRRLLERGLTLASAEGASGGLLSALLEEAKEDLGPAGLFDSNEPGLRDQDARGGHIVQYDDGVDLPRALAGSVIAWRPETMRTLLPTLELLKRLPTGINAGAAEVVAAVALAVRTMFAADVGLAIGYPYAVSAATGTGASDVHARPSEDENETGTVRRTGARPQLRLEIALAVGDDITTRTLTLPPLGRAWARERSAFFGLHFLLRSVLR